MKEVLEVSRETMANFLHVSEEELCFCSSASEANVIILSGVFFYFLSKAMPVHFIVSAIEHPSVLRQVSTLHALGLDVDIAPVNSSGIVDLEVLGRMIRPDTRLLSIMAANHEVGSIQPLSEIARLCKKNEILFHSDASQALGKMPFSISGAGLDFASFSSQKAYSIRGAGLMFIRNKQALFSLWQGGQEKGIRFGTENVLSISCFAQAITFIQSMPLEILSRLGGQLRSGLRQIPDTKIWGDIETSLPNTVSFCVRGISSEALLMRCDMEGMSLSAGAACATGSIEPSHVLKAMGISDEDSKSTIRISFGLLHTEEDINEFLERLSRLIHKMRH